MYNEELKTAFVRDTITNIKTAENCEAFFEAISQFEEEWGKDICTANQEEIRAAMLSVIGMRKYSKVARMSILRNYLNWCVQNGIPNANNQIPDMEDAGLDKVKSMMVANPYHLQTCLNAVFDPEEEQTMGNVYRCYFWLAYGGLPEQEVLKVSIDEVDFRSMEIRHGKYTVPIYRQALDAFRNAAELYEFKYKHPLYTNVISRPRVDGKCLLRGVKTDADLNTLHATVSRQISAVISKNPSMIKLSYSRMYLSGLFYRMYERELAGVPVNFMAAAADFMQDKIYDLSSTRNTLAAKQRKVAKAYLEDYLRWKTIFIN